MADDPRDDRPGRADGLDAHMLLVCALLDRIRREQVRRLFVETQLMVKEIIARVGYVDVNNFIRKFRQPEGMIPQKYRREHSAPESANPGEHMQL